MAVACEKDDPGELVPRGAGREKLRRRGEHAGRAADGLEHDRCQLAPVTVDLGQKAVAIAVRSISGRRRWSKLHEWLAEPKG